MEYNQCDELVQWCQARQIKIVLAIDTINGYLIKFQHDLNKYQYINLLQMKEQKSNNNIHIALIIFEINLVYFKKDTRKFFR